MQGLANERARCSLLRVVPLLSALGALGQQVLKNWSALLGTLLWFPQRSFHWTIPSSTWASPPSAWALQWDTLLAESHAPS